MKDCPSCSRSVQEHIQLCPTCDFSFGTPKKKTRFPEIAGALMILSAIIGLSFGLMLISGMEGIYDDVQPIIGEEVDEDLFYTLLDVCGAVFLILGGIQIITGVISITRRYWIAAVIGSVLGIFMIGVMFISSVLSAVALILLLKSKDEFS